MATDYTLSQQERWLRDDIAKRDAKQREAKAKLRRVVELRRQLSGAPLAAQPAPHVRALLEQRGVATTDEIAQVVRVACSAYEHRSPRDVRRRIQKQLSQWDWVSRVGRGRWSLADG